MKGWTIRFGEHSWTDDQVNTAQLIAVAELIGDNWEDVSPWNGPRVLAAWLVVLLAADSGDLDAAVSAVYAMPLRMLCEALDEREAPSEDGDHAHLAVAV